MFQGTMIEDLISSVMRAEEHARQTKQTAAPARFARTAAAVEYPVRRMEWREQELVGVA
jgi:hypothetical protein